MSAFDISPARYRLKKLARRFAVRVGQSIYRQSAFLEKCIRVLTYHRFGGSPLDPCSLEPRIFQEQLDWLVANANVLTPSEFDAVMSGRRPIPPRAVLISIDDGHSSVAEHALPALDNLGLKSILFVCPKLATDRSRYDQHWDERFMSWKELSNASNAGHTIASHGYSHQSLGCMPIEEALREIDRASSLLASELGTSGPFFSFPFGTRADYSPALADALFARGFRYCFTSIHGRCLPQMESVLLPRIKIEGGNEQDLFPHIVRGCIDHWQFVDHALCVVQQRGRM
jgi:peptidoglycan/xylan/chitin deacetylase (PgdA/CDA1 family)